MASAIQPAPLFSCLQTIVLEPYLEGAERVNRAFNGVNLHHIYHPEINFLTRVWTLLVGLSLMIPFINCVIWIFMKTFGNPEQLQENSPTPFFFLDPIQPPRINEENIAKKEQTFIYNETSFGQPYQASWNIKTYEEEHVVTRDDGVSVSTATYDQNWNQKKFSLKNFETSVLIERKKGMFIVAKGVHQEDPIHKVFTLNPKYPWIQQPFIGFRPFLLSNEKKLTFCGINPTNPKKLELDELTASKEEDTLEGHGRVIKLNIKFTGLKSLLGRIGECWFNSKTNELIQLKYRVKFFGKVHFEGDAHLVSSKELEEVSN